MKTSASAGDSADAAAAAQHEEATRKQIRGSSLLLAGRFLTLASNLVVQVLIVRYLSKADFGAFAYALSLVSVGASIVTFGLDRSITRFVPIYDEQRDYPKLFGTVLLAVGTVLSLGLVTLVLVYGLEAFLDGSLIGDEQAVSILLILVLLVPINALDGLLMGMFAVFSKPRAIFFRRHVLTPALRLTIVLLLVLGNRDVLLPRRRLRLRRGARRGDLLRHALPDAQERGPPEALQPSEASRSPRARCSASRSRCSPPTSSTLR